MKSIGIRNAEIHKYKILHGMMFPSAVELLMCHIHINSPGINQNTQDKENLDNVLNDNPTADETCLRYLGLARLAEWIIDKDHGDSSDTAIKLCSADQ